MNENVFPLSEESTCEEVAVYICNELNLKDEIKNILINEYITGDVLPLLTQEDLSSFGLKLGPRKKISLFIKENKTKFKERKLPFILDINSSTKQIKDYLKSYIDFQGEINDLDVKELFEMTEEKMKILGFKFGQRKRLIKYINYFKTLNTKYEKDEEILITKNSSTEEVAKFFKLKLHFSQDIIDELELDGELLFSLQDEEIDDLDILTLEQKQKLKKLIKEKFTKIEEEKEEIKIDRNSPLEDLLKFLKKKLNFSDKSIEFIKNEDLDSEILFNLNAEEIYNLDGISNQEKERLKIFLNEYNNKEKENEILKSNISKTGKKQNEKNENNLEDINYNEEKKSINFDGSKNNTKIKDIKFMNQRIENNDNDNEIEVREEDKIRFYSFKNFVQKPLKNQTYNIFFSVTLYDNQSSLTELGAYKDESNLFSSIYFNYKANLILKINYKSNESKQLIFYLFQISIKKPLKKLYITLKNSKTKKEYNAIIEVNNIENFFFMNNLKYDGYCDYPFVISNTIFSNYLDFFWEKTGDFEEKLQKALIKSIISKISKEDNVSISCDNFFRILKLCSKFKVEFKARKDLEIKIKPLVPEIYINEEELDNILSYAKQEIIDLIVASYININPKYLIKLTIGKSKSIIYRSILNLVSENNPIINNLLSIFNINEFNIFQKKLLMLANGRKELESVVNLKNDLVNSLNFILKNIDIILKFDYKNFPINLKGGIGNDDINKIYTLVQTILDNKSSKKEYKLISIEEIFENLLNFSKNKD